MWSAAGNCKWSCAGEGNSNTDRWCELVQRAREIKVVESGFVPMTECEVEIRTKVYYCLSVPYLAGKGVVRVWPGCAAVRPNGDAGKDDVNEPWAEGEMGAGLGSEAKILKINVWCASC